MASLQKFKLLATHCSTVTESPTRSPVIHLRRRKTLRMLLSGSSDRRWQSRRRGAPEIQTTADKSPDSEGKNRGGGAKREKIRSRRKLKELFVSSPERESGGGGAAEEMDGRRTTATGGANDGGDGDGSVARRIGLTSSLRPVSATFRSRLLRKAWRPVLVTIPEQ